MLVCIVIHLLFCCGFTNSVIVYCYTFIVLLWIHKQCYCVLLYIYCFVVDSETVLVCIAINVLFCCGFTNSVIVKIYCFVVDSQTVLLCIAIHLLFCCEFTNSVSVYCYTFIILLWIHKQC